MGAPALFPFAAAAVHGDGRVEGNMWSACACRRARWDEPLSLFIHTPSLCIESLLYFPSLSPSATVFLIFIIFKKVNNLWINFTRD